MSTISGLFKRKAFLVESRGRNPAPKEPWFLMRQRKYQQPFWFHSHGLHFVGEFRPR